MTHYLRNPLTPLELFRAGRDTADIAATLGMSEALAHRLLNEQRSADRGRPDPYNPNVVHQTAPKRDLVPFAGK